MKDDALFCVGQKALIEKDGKVLILYEADGALDFPGGKIQEGEAKNEDKESLILALRREVREETGLEIEVLDPFTVSYYEFEKGHRNYPKVVYLVYFRAKYVSGELKLSDEHANFAWVDRNDYQTTSHGKRFSVLEGSVLGKYFAGSF